MNKTKKEIEQCWRGLCAEASPDFDIPIHDDIPLPMIMVQGWFYDQVECFELLLQELTDEEQQQLFASRKHLESVEAKLKRLWGQIKKKAVRVKGMHKHQGILKYEYFCYWIEQLYVFQDEAGGLETAVRNLGTVEAAHDRFKEFYRTKPIRILNAADTARLLARCDYVEPEKRPLLTRGALLGAALLLDCEPHGKGISDIDKQYRKESDRIFLEERAAAYIDNTEELQKKSISRWKMEKGEGVFCELQKRLK